MDSTFALTRPRIEQAAATLRGHVRHTPVLEVDGADVGLAGVTLVFKLEFLQHGGSFKARGALLNLLTRPVPPVGVVAASGGNHGVAVALAARRTGHAATIFVPSVCSPAKLAQIALHGAQVRIAGDRYADALAASQAWQRETGALAIHAFDQVETLLGQATVAVEFEAQAPELDAVRVAVGAGGTLGVGLGESHQKLFFLPAAHTDFILSIVGEELGFAGVAAVLILFAIIVWRGLKAAHAASDGFGCYLALGLTLLLSLEAIVNAGMALALLPTKGMALPFISYGMSSVISSCLAAGILLSISGGGGGFLQRGVGAQR